MREAQCAPGSPIRTRKETRMSTYQKIVFVSQALNEVDSLKQTLNIAKWNNAELSALIVCPESPHSKRPTASAMKLRWHNNSMH